MNSNKEFSFKLILVGDGGSGKTTFVKRHKTGEYTLKYKPTVGCAVYFLDFTTNKGKVVFGCWDTAGQEKFGGLRDGYYVGSDCAIVMFDLSFRSTYKNIPVWYRDVSRICFNIPIAIVGNKYDLLDKKDEEERVMQFRRKYGSQYMEISARKNYNYEKPFLYLMRRLLKNNDVDFIAAPSLIPPDYKVDEKEHQKHIEETKRGASIPIPTALY